MITKELLYKNKYIILCSLLFIFMFFHMQYGQWGADFWEHAAVVNELSTNIIHPRHPILNINLPHAFYSPYLLLVGAFTKIFSCSSMFSLKIFGMINLIVLLAGFRLFINTLFQKELDNISFYSLIFVLFCWPASALHWSGFINFKSICYVLPYPSTISVALSFIMFYLLDKSLSKYNFPGLIISTLLLAIIILTHLPTAVFAVLTVFVITLDLSMKNKNPKFLIGNIIILLALTLCFLWPYYPFFDLITTNSSDFNNHSHLLYLAVFSKIWPTIILFFFSSFIFISRLKKNYLDNLSWLLILSSIIYLSGYYLNIFGVGRIISFISIIVHIAAGAKISALAINMKKDNFFKRVVPLIVFMIAVSLTINLDISKRAVKGLIGRKFDYHQYHLLKDNVKQYDVVLANISDSWKIPSFTGKVIASYHPLYWITDADQRKNDIKNFFSNEKDQHTKKIILDKYEVDYIYLNKINNKYLKSYLKFGSVQYENNNYCLIKVHKKQILE